MKKFFFAIVGVMASVSLFAQVDSTNVDSSAMNAPADSSSQAAVSTDPAGVATITDEDLKKYAIVMDSVDGMKQSLMTEISTKIKGSNIKIARYNQLNKAAGDDAKLKELKATPEEIAFVKEISALKTEGAQKISSQVETLASDFVGVEKYNMIKSSLETDPAVKSKYDQIFSQVQNEGTASAKTQK